ncbi:MAG TPA: glycerol-3-phosphate 1-O-acyltransferase PlsY [Gaiellales bacterium]|jgi:glycerol-3-phosphate acyltransferase PlsY
MTGAVAAIAIGYVLGSCPFGYWAGRLRGVDLRTQGSGNTGGTNAIRVLGPAIGVPALVLDIAKGAAAVAAASLLGGTGIEVLAAAAAIVGHTFSMFLGFRGGGKAVATGAGAMLALAPEVALPVVVLWIVVSLATRYISVASMASAVALVAGSLVSDQPWPVVAFSLFGAALVVWRHRSNIARLRAGTEHRLNLRGARS